ncbi:MAG: hypothetical protein JHC31_13440 [Sulfurihydrogenibium sp.]|jgi:hypothetical protein|nr:hypothetical protein [Sulfurihydrogenibium sp.]
MTNREFIDFVVREKKVPYDDALLSQIWNYFKIAVQDLETRIDFAYNYRTSLFSVLKNNYFIIFPENVKYIKSVFDKRRKVELYGDKDTKSFYLMFNAEVVGYPTRYFYDAVDKKLYFSCSLVDNSEYVVDYYVYTYDNDTLFTPDNTHPLLLENFELLNLTVGMLIERFYSADINLEAKLKEYFEINERARQEKRKYSKTTIRIDNPRY